MTSSSHLFSEISLGPLTLPNRIMVSPMCQYSADDGNAGDWHRAHLSSLALSGAGILFVEATAIAREGRITPHCLGLYSDANEAALRDVLAAVRSVSPIALGIQLSYAGRKGSCAVPWQGGALLPESSGGWRTIGPSALAYKPGNPEPLQMDAADMARVLDYYRSAARRARRLGFQAIELQMAHGYLAHQFLSPLANVRDDEFGGTLENRMRFPLSIFEAVHGEVGADIPVGVRVSATDWVDGGWDLEQTTTFCTRLEALGCAFLDISSGGLSPLQRIAPGAGYQAEFAAHVKSAVGVPVIAVGLITAAQQAEDILARGAADMVALARAMLFDPRWPWRAAAELGGKVRVPPQLQRSLPHGHAPIFQGPE